MMRKICLFLLFGSIFYSLEAQTKFQRVYKMTWGDAQGAVAVPLRDSTGYFFEISTTDPTVSYYDVCLLKTNLFGDTIWTKYYGGGGTKGFNKFHQDMNGSVTMIGGSYVFGSGSLDGYLVRINSVGDTICTKAIGNNLYNALTSSIRLNNGNVAMLMYTDSSFIGRNDSGIIMVDSTGNVLWNRFFEGGLMNDCGALGDFVQVSDGGFILEGYSVNYTSGGTDFYAIRTDSLGNLIWAKSYGGLLDEASTSLVKCSDGFILAGATNGFGALGADILLIKIDINGNVLWSKTYQTPLDESVSRIIRTSDDGFIISGAGPHVTTGSDRKGYLMKIDSSGNFQWAKSYGSSSCNDDLGALSLAPDGGFLFSGATCSFGSVWQSYIIKADSLGNSGCYQQNESFTTTDVTGSILTSNWSPINYYDSSIVSKPTSTIVRNHGASLSITTLCFTTDVEETEKLKDDVKIYPNPNNGSFSFEYKLKSNEIGLLNIMDVTGKLVSFHTLEGSQNSLKIKADDLNNGVYLYQIIVNGNVVSSDKLIIIR